MNATWQKIIFMAMLFMATFTFLIGLNWGLPSRESDPILFGDRTPWTGKQIMDFAGSWEEDGPRGADIAMHPLPGNRDRSIILNDTDSKRAQIVRRFRLYSSQPDEMITFRSLSRMKPAKFDFDPRLYQYGGLWIYPIGLLLKLGSVCHLIALRTDLAYYLDHPDSFARFYLLARAYTALWGLLGAWVVFAIGREWTGKFSVGITAAGLFGSLPVVIDLAHEAKPHLPGTVLILLTAWAAMKFVRGGKSRWWVFAGMCAGAAMGMVLTGYVAFAILPAMTLLRPICWRDRIRITAFAVLIGITTFALCNPYLPYHLLFNRQVLHSNVGNYGTFYQPRLTATGICFAARCILLGLSPGPAIIGGLGLIASIFQVASGRRKMNPIGILFAAPVSLVMIQFVLLADGKTAEYARFTLMPVVAIALCAAGLVHQLQFTGREKSLGSALLIASTLYFGIRYDLNFLADNRPDSTRRTAARTVGELQSQSKIIAVWAEPAPYCLPAVDLFRWRIVLLPKGANPTATGTVSLRPIDEPTAAPPGAIKIMPSKEPDRADSPVGWANKPFEILKW